MGMSCFATRQIRELYGFGASFIRLRQERSLLMTENILGKLFEHNNWANLQIIQACSALSDEQLDAEPQSATMGTIRATLTHLAGAQAGYLSLLTLPVEARLDVPQHSTSCRSPRASAEKGCWYWRQASQANT